MERSLDESGQKPASRRFALLVLCILLADVATFIFCEGFSAGVGFEHDSYRLGYPLRVLISTSFRNFIFPLWDHWSFAGAPLLSIYTPTAISPIVFVLSCFGIYSPDSFIAEMVITHILGFLGMVAWLRLFHKNAIPVFGATAYCLSAYMLTQFSINFEGGVSPCMYPWFAFGLTTALQGRIRGAGVMALSLFVMFTTGYLGTNVIALQILSVFCVALVIAERPDLPFHRRDRGSGLPPRRRPRRSRRTRTVPQIRIEDARGIAYALLGFGLFICLINLLLWETFANLSLSYFTERRVDPYTAATRWPSMATLFFPNGVSPFVPDRFGAHWSILYIGLLPVYFVIYAVLFLSKDRRVLLASLFAVLTYLACLSREHAIGRMLVEAIPFYDRIRFHAWNSILVVFFLVTAGSFGMNDHLGGAHPGRRRLSAIAFLAVGGCAFWIEQWVGAVTASGPYPQLLFIPVWWFILSFRWAGGLSGKTVALTVLLMLEIIAVNGDRVRLYPPGQTPHALEVARLEQITTSGFPPPSNTRLADTPDHNQHYLTKQVSWRAYMPNIHPAIAQLATKRQNDRLFARILYFRGADDEPVKSDGDPFQITALTPGRLEARISAGDEGRRVVWSSPFSSNWHLTVNGVEQRTERSSRGLTEFAVAKGDSTVVLSYEPFYFWFAMVTMFGALFVTAFVTISAGRPTGSRALLPSVLKD